MREIGLHRRCISMLPLRAMFVTAVIVTAAAQAQTYTVLHRFGPGTDGTYPQAGLIGDSAGGVAGTNGGGNGSGFGAVFKLDEMGLTVLHDFTGGADGGSPVAGLIQDSAGNLYGTTSSGGTSGGWGVVFKLDTTGTETVVYSFTGGADGAQPYAALIRDSAGNLYGTTVSGGTGNCDGFPPFGCGVVFKLDTTGKETVLHTFTGRADGAQPQAGLIRDSAGNLYGTTYSGGASNYGVVFKLDTTGTETVLHTFTGGMDGGYSFAGLIRDSAGNLYGTTNIGGASVYGVVFKLDKTGETVLYSFKGGADGANPVAGLVRDSVGNLYGTARSGGASNNGVVFKLDATGTETVLYSFTGGAGGANPVAGLIRDSAGNLYGTTLYGGITASECKSLGGCGVVFKLEP